MTILLADRVEETTTTTGNGTYTLAGAKSGFRTFTSVVATGSTCYYACALGSDWEVGVGTMASSTTLSRTTILASSNAGAAVSWAAGTKDIFITTPASIAKGSVPIEGIIGLPATYGNSATINGCDYLKTGVTALSSDYPLCSTVSYNDASASTWTTRTLPSTAYWERVTYVGAISGLPAWFIQDTLSTSILQSTDGTTWTSYGGAAFILNSIVYSGTSGTCVNVCTLDTASSKYWNGSSWSSGSGIAIVAKGGVAYGGGYFVAVGEGAFGATTTSCSYSSDGITWSTGTMSGTAYSWGFVNYAGNKFFAGGYSLGASYYYATTPTSWTLASPAQMSGWTNGVKGVAYGGGIYVALGYDGLYTYACTSSDGVTWSTANIVENTGGGASGLLYAGGVFVFFLANPTSGICLTSPDGVTWTIHSADSVSRAGMAYGGGVFVVTSAGSAAAAYTAPLAPLECGVSVASYADPDKSIAHYMRVS